MTEFPAPTPSGYSLAALRAAIDAHDETILNALTARQRMVDRIRDVKNREGQLVYRPAREAQILKRLLAAADPALDKTLVHQLWREIFSSAVSRQESLTIAVTAENPLPELARQHFGHAAKITLLPAVEAFQQLLQAKVALAIVPASAATDIIIAAKSDPQIRINGILPFLSGGAPVAYVLGRLTPEESGEDITLIANGEAIEFLPGFQPDHPNCIGTAPRPWRQDV